MNIKQREVQLAPKDRVRFRKDLRCLKLCNGETLTLTRRNIYSMGPWTREMAEFVLKPETKQKFTDLLKQLRGKKIEQPELSRLFFLTKAYNRLAEMQYERKKHNTAEM